MAFGDQTETANSSPSAIIESFGPGLRGGYNSSAMAVGTTRISFLHRLRNRADQVSWAEFHDRYGELLFNYARRRGAGHAEAEDIVQDVEMSLFKAMGKFRYDARKGRFRAYLRTSVIRAMGRQASKRAAAGENLDPLVIDHISEDRVSKADVGQDDPWDREWQLHRLRWALRSIAHEFEPATLAAFRLVALANRPAAETATELGLTRDSVYQAKSRVLKRLKERIRSLDPDEDAWT